MPEETGLAKQGNPDKFQLKQCRIQEIGAGTKEEFRNVAYLYRGGIRKSIAEQELTISRVTQGSKNFILLYY